MIKAKIAKYLEEQGYNEKIDHPSIDKFGDFAVRGDFKIDLPEIEKTEKVAGFTNIWIKEQVLIDEANKILNGDMGNELKKYWSDKKIMVEYAHPNTHKELHIGHLRTLITGEALARLFESVGTKVFRANYQGDIGPHVAKAIWGVKHILLENKGKIDDWEIKTNEEKAHFLGKAYVLGCQEYEINPTEIDEINQKLYQDDPDVREIYKITRNWSLNYYDDFYKRFYTKFDQLFFESEIDSEGKKIVLDNVGKIFEVGEGGAIVFDGKKYGLHKRVFVTGAGTVTYEGKEMGLAYAQKKAFGYDKNIHVVGNEQAGYFKVVIKAMEILDSWFIDRQYHLAMGMVNLVGKKMSSRTGDIVTVDSIIDETKNQIKPLVKELAGNELEEVAEIITIGAIKFSVLKSDPKQNSIFDIKKSIDISGGSGPYLQYTYARCHSVLDKSKTQFLISNLKFLNINEEEKALLRYFYQFGEKIIEAAERYNPSVVAEYLLNLARKYNEFYAKCRIVGEKEEEQRLFFTAVTAKIIKEGLTILGIKTLNKM